ncbi:hypothetical protein GCM10022286_00880 [Gryllotalpicola daejeonensis]|uniref:Uncharacterized protein n=1 Tax=Gryllotalpicola daejeonensis TaxID=993087 RepID=A0ABP7ZCW9_9MICO
MGGQTRYPSRIDQAIIRGEIRPQPVSLPERISGPLREVRPVRVWVTLEFLTPRGPTWVEIEATAQRWNKRFVEVSAVIPGGDAVTAIVFASACRRYDADEELAKRRKAMEDNRSRRRGR